MGCIPYGIDWKLGVEGEKADLSVWRQKHGKYGVSTEESLIGVTTSNI